MPSVKKTRGIAFPFQRGSVSFPMEASGSDVFISNVKSLLFTGRGELPMRPQYGTGLHDYIYETMTPIKKSLLANEVRRVITENILNVRVLGVEVGDTGADGVVKVLIAYSINGEVGEVELKM